MNPNQWRAALALFLGEDASSTDEQLRAAAAATAKRLNRQIDGASWQDALVTLTESSGPEDVAARFGEQMARVHGSGRFLQILARHAFAGIFSQ